MAMEIGGGTTAMQVSDDESAMIASGLQPVQSPRDGPVKAAALPQQSFDLDNGTSDSDEAQEHNQAPSSNSSAKVS